MNEIEQLVPDQELLTRYGCGPIRFSGRDDALYERHLIFDDVVAPEAAGPRERFEAAAHSVRDVLSQRWILTDRTYDRENPKRIYYLSMEFLIGRSLSNNITNLLLDPLAKEIADRKNLDPFGLIEQEPDAGLGNGGLGRLAACFLELNGDDAAPSHGLRAALRIRHLQTDPFRTAGSTRSRTIGCAARTRGRCPARTRPSRSN